MKRILVVKLSSLGDLFHALPAVNLIQQHTGAKIDWVCHRMYLDLVAAFAPVDRAIAYPRHSFFRDGGPFFAALRKEQYDLALDFQGLLKSAMVMRAARAARRIGPSFCREGSHVFYDAVSGPLNKKRHAVDECLDTVRFLGLPDAPVEFPVNFPSVPLDVPRPRVGLLPCSRRAEKNWPILRFAEVARAIAAQSAATFLVLGGPADAESCAALTGLIGDSAQNWCGRTSMLELGGVLRELDLLITVDSGPMHMAAAVGTPTVAVFGPTDPVKTGPYGKQHRVIRDGKNLRDQAIAPVITSALAALRES